LRWNHSSALSICSLTLDFELNMTTILIRFETTPTSIALSSATRLELTNGNSTPFFRNQFQIEHLSLGYILLK